jgi:hypothetical protein
VSSCAQLLVRAYEYRLTRLVVVDHRAEVRRADLRTDSGVPTVALTEIHFNTIVFLALCLALPRPWSRRQLERLAMGWSVLYLSQALNLLFHVKFLYASAFGAWSLQNYSIVARNVFGFLQYATDLPGRFAFPFALWLGFSGQIMPIIGLHQRRSKPPRRKPGRDARSRSTERARRIVRCAQRIPRSVRVEANNNGHTRSASRGLFPHAPSGCGAGGGSPGGRTP